MIKELVDFCILWFNDFPTSGNIYYEYTPHNVLESLVLEFNKKWRIKLGSYDGVQNKPTPSNGDNHITTPRHLPKAHRELIRHIHFKNFNMGVASKTRYDPDPNATPNYFPSKGVGKTQLPTPLIKFSNCNDNLFGNDHQTG